MSFLRTFSTRTVAIMWWFFTLIMMSSYTANLAGTCFHTEIQLDNKNLAGLLSKFDELLELGHTIICVDHHKMLIDNAHHKIEV